MTDKKLIEIRNEFANETKECFTIGTSDVFKPKYTEWLENKLIALKQSENVVLDGVIGSLKEESKHPEKFEPTEFYDPNSVDI